jgi:hypothetical protein
MAAWRRKVGAMRRRKKAGGGADPTGFRKFLYGDCDMAEWPGEDVAGDDEPWVSFVRAREAYQRGATEEAEARWRAIADRPGEESRTTLQAWHFLRSIGVGPPDAEAKRVLGAIAEVAVGSGHDVLAVYADGSVRYLNAVRGGVVIDAPIEAVTAPAQDLLGIGQALAEVLEPWEGRSPDLARGHTRILMLTPSGPHFGQGPSQALQADEAAGAFLSAAMAVLTAVAGLATPS